MQRLRDRTDARDPREAKAARLLGAVPARPPSNSRRRALLASQGATVSSGAPRFLRPAFAALALFCSLAFASAILGRAWFHRPVAPTVLPTVSPTLSPTLSTTETAPPIVVPTLPISPVAPPAVASPAHESTARTTATPRPKSPTAEEMAGVLAAVKALRHDRDPARATALLNEYLHHYPRGALLEEALALAIEAAAEENDPRAVNLAEQYSVRYPQGRFIETAKQAEKKFAR